MNRAIGVTEVRRHLRQLLETVQRHPDQRVAIAVHGTVVAHLVAPPTVRTGGAAAKALLRLSHQLKPRMSRRIRPTRMSEEHDRYLYEDPSHRATRS